MMREHMGLYRGKRLCNGKWMQGNLLQYPDGTCYICHTGSRLDRYKVDPDTVGECCGGLRDKNGKLIFEGSIVKYGAKVGYIVFGNGCYSVQDIRSENRPAIDIVLAAHDIEIIGNIHDNPELLKGGAE